MDELRREASEDVFGGYEDSPEVEDDDDTLTPPEEGGREVTPSPQVDEPSEPDYESMSRRDLEIELDAALDAGDMDLVRQIGSILNTK